MVFRSACSPMLIGLGTTAILATFAVSSVAATDPGPTATGSPMSGSPSGSPLASPSASPTPTPPPVPVLSVAVRPPSGKLHPGDSAQAVVYVYATGAVASKVLLTVSADRKVVVSPVCVVSKNACVLKRVGQKGKFTTVNVKIPTSVKPGSVTIRAAVTDSADKAARVTDQKTFTVRKTPAAKNTKPPSGGSGGSNGSGGSGGSGGTSGSNGSNSSTGGTGNSANPGSSVIPPLPTADTNAPSVALPPVAQTPVAQPSLAPTAPVAAPDSVLRADSSPAPTALTFERLASTQAAWLLALLAALSLLLTQVRINRIATGQRRPKGDHRRPRRGIFGA